MVNHYKIFQTLSSEVRIAVLHRLAGGAMKTVGALREEVSEEYGFELSQPMFSHHMKKLRECGLVELNKRSQFNYHTLNQEFLDEIIESLEGLKSN